MNRYRVRSQKLFLTYPQCNATKERLYEFLLEESGWAPQEVLVAHELHKNGDNHLHAFVDFGQDRAKEFTAPNFADFDGYHGNYQGCRSAKNVLKYCTKGDDYVANFDVNAILTSGKNAKAVVGKR